MLAIRHYDQFTRLQDTATIAAMTAHREQYITDHDFARMAEAGITTVRRVGSSPFKLLPGDPLPPLFWLRSVRQAVAALGA